MGKPLTPKWTVEKGISMGPSSNNFIWIDAIQQTRTEENSENRFATSSEALLYAERIIREELRSFDKTLNAGEIRDLFTSKGTMVSYDVNVRVMFY